MVCFFVFSVVIVVIIVSVIRNFVCLDIVISKSWSVCFVSLCFVFFF